MSMKHLCIAALALSAVAVGVVWGGDEVNQMPTPVKEHQWLQQLVGEWESDVHVYMPGQPEMTSKGVETVRAVGGFWTVSENKGSMMGDPFTGLLTLGYDPASGKYIGTWIDSMSSMLWKYEGKLDESKTKLTLETTGPSCMDPTATADYRETLELKGKNQKVFESHVKGPDGNWTKMMRIEYRRRAAEGTK